MNTKEAVGFCRFVEDLDIYSGDNAYVVANGISCVVELLQRGEKYKEILKDIKYEINWHRPEREVYDSGNENDDECINETLNLIDKVEQKYFPKPEKNPYEELLENILWKAIKNVIEKNSELILKCMEKAEKNERET